jgi:AcrR family transcriptional regulator
MPKRTAHPLPTRERILENAERLFARHGFHGVSLRSLARAAEVNLAAVHYHFGDMSVVFSEVFSRNIKPLNNKWIDLLELLKNEPLDDPKKMIEKIISALCEPIFDMCVKPERGGKAFQMILSRCFTEPLDFSDSLLAREYHPVLAQFARSLRRCAPKLSPCEFMWRFNFIVGAMHHTLGTLHRMTDLTRGICQDNDYQSARQYFVLSSVAIVLAPGGGKCT